jgi:glycosyltransferase involved in cell wall biosynthesis
MVTVSTALCTYNGAAYIGEQLDSILSQTRVPDEIVIADDGSTDDTLEIVRRHTSPAAVAAAIAISTAATSSVSIRVLASKKAGRGVTANFERAIAATTGDIVLLSDQDDRWMPDRVTRTLDVFAREPLVQFVFGDARMVDSSGSDLGYTLFEALEFSTEERRMLHADEAFASLLRRNLATGATAAFRRELAERSMPFPGEWVHDEWLAIMASVGGRLGVIDAPLIDYRQHGANQIGMQRRGLRHKIDRVLQSRGERNRDLVRRTRVLLERLEDADSGATPAEIEQVQGKLRIESVRANLPKNRLLRLPTVLREAKTGDYERYTSQGRAEVLRDLLQPA